MLLDKINNANDIKKIKSSEYDALAQEIRTFLVENVSKTGGHLASNLGVVELTMALHLVLDLPEDKIIWDVGHQSYVHKLLTGRKDDFPTLRTYGGMSGFPKRRESEFDAFNTGHSSTSISAALGMATAALQNKKNNRIVAVIGDGALTGGMAYEAINNVAKLERNLVIILNDNNMSISENVGGISSYLSLIRVGEGYNNLKVGVSNTLESIPVVGEQVVKNVKKTKDSIKKRIMPGNLFEDMGISYYGPFDGHNVNLLKKVIRQACRLDHPVIVHVCTCKGKGYLPAEKHADKFHGVGTFNPKTGRLTGKRCGKSWTGVFSDALLEAAGEDKRITAITAAMADGTGLSKFKKKFPDRFFDVGIAEEHAVTFAAGQAAGGMRPFVAIYSSFLQRAYDQIMHDVCMQSLPVVLCIDRAGLVGGDGETHNGIFDISYLMTIPGMSIAAPKNAQELRAMVRFAAKFNAPLAIRYPRGEAFTGLEEFDAPIVYGKSEMLYEEKDIALLAAGSMVKTADEVRSALKDEGFNVTLVNVRFVKPVDEEMLAQIAKTHNIVVTLEENVSSGGFGMMVLKLMNNINPSVRVVSFAVPNSYIEQGGRDVQLRECGLDTGSILARLEEILGDEKETG